MRLCTSLLLLLLLSRLVVSYSVRPHTRQPTSLPRPWDSPGKNTGVGSHFLLQCRKVKSENEVAQSCPTLRDPMDFSPPGSSIHGIFQARVLEWGAIALTPFIVYLSSIFSVYGTRSHSAIIFASSTKQKLENPQEKKKKAYCIYPYFYLLYLFPS